MANKRTFVSGCDANYYPMLLEWVHSVRRFEQAAEFDICIMDTGLLPQQVQHLSTVVDKIVKPDWPCDLPVDKIHGKDFLKSCVCRPFIPQIFPGYDLYMWMDADTWVQDWRAIDLFMQGAARKKITLTGQVDRAYPKAARIKWLGRWPWKVRNFYFTNALKAFDFKTAKHLLSQHVLLAGTFAMHVDAPHWSRWQALVIHAMRRGNVFTAEQTSLGKLCYLEGYPFEILPGWTHWLCEFKPLWDAQDERFIEPYLPHEPIGILHVSGYDDMRLDRNVLTDFVTADGERVEKSYRYPHYDGEKLQEMGS